MDSITRHKGLFLPLVVMALMVGALALWGDAQPASAHLPVLSEFSAGDFVIFAQAREGKAEEGDKQASVSGSNNSLFGRIWSGGDFDAGGQNNFFHYPGNTGDDKIASKKPPYSGDNFYETPLNDPRHLPGDPSLDYGTGLPAQESVPLGSVTEGWPGNLHQALLSNGLDMNADDLEQFCDFGSLTGTREDFDLVGSNSDGTYCTNGGEIKLSAQKVGASAAPKRFTFLANDGLITISGQEAFIEPFELGVMAMSDLDSDSDQFPIKISGSDFHIGGSAVAFSSKSGVDVSGPEPLA